MVLFPTGGFLAWILDVVRVAQHQVVRNGMPVTLRLHRSWPEKRAINDDKAKAGGLANYKADMAE
jgi:hypothetical protein